MDVPAHEDQQAATGAAGPISLEIVEFELALKHQSVIDLGFEGAVRRALASAGGTLLFQMRMDNMNCCDWVAGVSIGRGEHQRYALVVKPAGDAPLRLEEAATSEIPLARIMPAYASLVERYGATA